MKDLLAKVSQMQQDLAVAHARNKVQIDALEQKIAELTPLATYGKDYHDGLVADYVKFKLQLGEVQPEKVAALKVAAAGLDIDFLKKEISFLVARVFGKSFLHGDRPLRPHTAEEQRAAREKSSSPLRPKTRVSK